MLWDRAGRRVGVLARGPSGDRLLALIAERAPWAFIGYDAKLDAAGKRDWPSVVAAVDRRRSTAVGGAPPAGPSASPSS